MRAHAFRKWAGVNNSMQLERMYRTIKHTYLQGKQVKWLDESIHNLMQFLCDKTFERIIALEKAKISSKMSTLKSRHKSNLYMNQSGIHTNSEERIVKSQGNACLHYA